MAGNRVVIKFIGEDSSLGRSLTKLAALTKATEDHFSKLRGTSTSALDKMAGAAGAAANAFKVLAVGGVALQGVNLVVAAVTELSGGLLLLPAAIGMAGAAFATFKLATSGFMDAFKDTKAGRKAFEGLSDGAKQTVLAVKALNPEFERLRHSVQDRFFAGFAGEVKLLGGVYFPILGKWLPQIASGFNRMGRELSIALRAPKVRNSIVEILANTSKLLAAMPHTLGNLATGFFTLAGAGSKHLAPLGRLIDGLAGKFADWATKIVNSGQFDAWANKAIDGFSDLLDLVSNVAIAIGTVFSALDEGARQAGGAVDGLSGGGIKAFVEDLGKLASGFFADKGVHAALVALGAAMTTVAGAAQDVLVSGLTALAPIIAKIAPVAGHAAEILGKLLLKAIIDLSPAIKRFLDWFVPWVDRQLPKIADVIETMVVPAIIKMMDYLGRNKEAVKSLLVVGGLIVAALAGPFSVVGLAIAGAAVAFIEFYGAIKWAGKFVLEVVSMIIGGFGDLFDTLSHLPGMAATFTPMRDAAYKARDGINHLTGSIDQLHPKTVDVGVKGTGDAKKQVDSLKHALDAIPLVKSVMVQVRQSVGALVGGIFGGHRALGGPVSGGRSYVVGESGPEVITMGGAGSVTPNNRLGGGGGQITFGGNVDSAFATAFMKLVRSGQIQIG
jgi:hypothetical protein